MAGTIIGTPDSPPTVDADWDKVISNYVVGGKGQNSISLTNWASANTTKPAIESGSTIEVNGSFAEFTSTVIGDDGSLVTGTIYLFIDVTTTPGTALPKFTNTAPTWDAAKDGFYSGNNRYTGHVMNWDGASEYAHKRKTEDKENIQLLYGPDGIYIGQKYITGSTIGYRDDTEQSSNSLSYVVRAAFTTAGFGVFNIFIDIQKASSGTGTTFARIMINNVEQQVWTTTSETYVTFNDDFDIVDGDLIELQIKTDAVGSAIAEWRNFRIKYGNVFTKGTRNIVNFE